MSGLYVETMWYLHSDHAEVLGRHHCSVSINGAVKYYIQSYSSIHRGLAVGLRVSKDSPAFRQSGADTADILFEVSNLCHGHSSCMCACSQTQMTEMRICAYGAGWMAGSMTSTPGQALKGQRKQFGGKQRED